MMYKINIDAVGTVSLFVEKMIDPVYRVPMEGDCAVYQDKEDKMTINPEGEIIWEDGGSDSALTCYINYWYNKDFIRPINS